MNTVSRERAINSITPLQELKPLPREGGRHHGPSIKHTQPLERRAPVEPKTAAQRQHDTFIRRRIFAGAFALATVGAGVDVVSHAVTYVREPDCAFSTGTTTVTMDSGKGWEFAARQVDGITDDTSACVDEAETRISTLNPAIGKVLLAGQEVVIPESVHIQSFGDLFGG